MLIKILYTYIYINISYIKINFNKKHCRVRNDCYVLQCNSPSYDIISRFLTLSDILQIEYILDNNINST